MSLITNMKEKDEIDLLIKEIEDQLEKNQEYMREVLEW